MMYSQKETQKTSTRSQLVLALLVSALAFAAALPATAAAADAFIFNPAWSPNGAKIAFSMISFDGVNPPVPHIYTINADGTGQTRLTNSGTDNDYPTWSPNGRQISFTRTTHAVRDGIGEKYGEIYTMDAANGSAESKLTNHIDGQSEGDPAWSPNNGTKIAFTKSFYNRGDRTFRYNIYVMDPGGTNPSPLMGLQPQWTIVGEPAWSPDDVKIAFIKNGDIYTMNANDGSNQTNLTNDVVQNYRFSPAWSPNGQKIAFSMHTSDGDGYQIYTMNADGTGQTRLTYSGQRNLYPTWSPDSAKIAFTGDSIGCDLRTGNLDNDIYVKNADGTGRASKITSSTSSQCTRPPAPPKGGLPPNQPSSPLIPKDPSAYRNACKLRVTSPKLKKGKKGLKASRKSAKRLFTHGAKGLITWGKDTSGNKVKCSDVKLALLKQDGKRYFVPGTRVRISSKDLNAGRFSKVMRKLKKKKAGILRSKEHGGKSTKFSYKLFNRRSKLGRQALKKLSKSKYRGTYTLFYKATVEGTDLFRKIEVSSR